MTSLQLITELARHPTNTRVRYNDDCLGPLDIDTVRIEDDGSLLLSDDLVALAVQEDAV